MSTATDNHVITTDALCEAARLTRRTLLRHIQLGNLAQPRRRPGVRQNLWTPTDANRFLRRLGKPAAF